jgi:hypothetical protein
MPSSEKPIGTQTAPEVIQGAFVSGDSNAVFNTGDVGYLLYQEQHVHRQHTPAVAQGQFFPIRLEDYSTRRWVDPPQTQELVQLLEEHHFLILAGALDEKKDCADHLVYQLCRRLEDQGRARPMVLEKCSGRDPQKIETVLDEEEAKILILPDISPRQIVGQTLVTLRNLLRTHHSYAVLTTENSREDWGIVVGSLDAQLWRELSWESYYGVPLLSRFLRQQLLDSDKKVPKPVLDHPDPQHLVAEISLDDAVKQLRTPSRVHLFCEWLFRAKEPVLKDEIEECLAELQGDDQGVARWYGQFDPRYQLLILGLILFDGLPDEIIFTGLELLVKNIWRSSDPSIPQFDYGDLVQCSAYFKKVESERGPTRIRSISQERRHCILKLVWNNQRRRLLLALPVLREMIRISASNAQPDEIDDALSATAPAAQPVNGTAQHQATGRALSRSAEDTLQLHQALVDSLGLISRLSPQVVEQHFLDLAADSFESVQRLAARALSTWRDDGHEQELLALLLGWWREACEIWNTESRIAHLGDHGDDPFAAVRAAVALTVGYSARFDRENQLAPPLYELLVKVLEDRNPRVKKAASQALQLAVAWHFRQLEPLLRMRVLHSDDFLDAVARGAAEACSLRTEETIAILDHWRALARTEKRHSSPNRISPRERLIATVALTYGDIRADRGEWPLGPEILCANLQSILMEEVHPFVRHHAFAAIEKQALQNFELVVRLLQDLLSQIQLRDRPAVVEIFVKTYLYQRQRLNGGDRKLQIAGRSYEIWMESPRPLTELEATLYGWLLDSSHPIVQQLAVDIFDRLGKTSLEIAERRMRARRPLPVKGPAAAGGVDQRPQPQVRPLPVLGWLAVLCVAPRKPLVRATLQPLLAEVISLQALAAPPSVSRPAARATDPPPPSELPRPPIDALLERWNGVPNDATKAVARLLGRAFFLYRWRRAILTLILLAALGVYYGTPAAYTWVREEIRQHRAAAQTAPPATPAAPLPPSTSDAPPAPAASNP